MDNLWNEKVTFEIEDHIAEYMKTEINIALEKGFEEQDKIKPIKGRRVTRMMLELKLAFK